jgi:hypothetical protein
MSPSSEQWSMHSGGKCFFWQRRIYSTQIAWVFVKEWVTSALSSIKQMMVQAISPSPRSPILASLFFLQAI